MRFGSRVVANDLLNRKKNDCLSKLKKLEGGSRCVMNFVKFAERGMRGWHVRRSKFIDSFRGVKLSRDSYFSKQSVTFSLLPYKRHLVKPCSEVQAISMRRFLTITLSCSNIF